MQEGIERGADIVCTEQKDRNFVIAALPGGMPARVLEAIAGDPGSNRYGRTFARGGARGLRCYKGRVFELRGTSPSTIQVDLIFLHEGIGSPDIRIREKPGVDCEFRCRGCGLDVWVGSRMSDGRIRDVANRIVAHMFHLSQGGVPRPRVRRDSIMYPS